jgi:6-phosphogluconolactonase
MSSTSQPTYISSYTDDGGEGIYLYSFKDGKLSLDSLATKASNPSFLAFHPNRTYVYCVNENNDYDQDKSGSVSAYERDSNTGALKLLNTVTSKGAHPCYITIDSAGSHVLVANYNGGSVATFPVQADGSLGEAKAFIKHSGESKVNAARQEAPHAHSINLTPSEQYAIALDLGDDKAVVYKYDRAHGGLEPTSVFKFKPGDGPRHLVFTPFHHSWCYAVAELSNEIVFLDIDENDGTLSEIQRLPALPEDFQGTNLASEINITPSGKFLYASMRGHDSLSIFAINENNGKLSKVGQQSTHGAHPRHFNIDPSGEYVIVGNKVRRAEQCMLAVMTEIPLCPTPFYSYLNICRMATIWLFSRSTKKLVL